MQRFYSQNSNFTNKYNELNNALEWELVGNLNITNSVWTGAVTLVRKKQTISNGVSDYEYHVYGRLKHLSANKCDWGEVIGKFDNVSIYYHIPIIAYSNRGVVYNGLIITSGGEIRTYSPICDSLINIEEEIYFSYYF